MIISSDEGNPSGLMRDFKKYTSKRIVEELRIINESRREWLLKAFVKAGKNLNRISKYKVWQDGNRTMSIEIRASLITLCGLSVNRETSNQG